MRLPTVVNTRSVAFLALSAGFLLLAGCEDEVIVSPKAGAPSTAPVKADRRADPAAATVHEEEEKTLPPAMDFQESNFVESDRSRDPFRNFAQAFVEEARGEVKSQREAVLEQYAIEQLKLVAIVAGIHPEKAMFVDPSGVGHVVMRGQFLGRATVVQPSGGVGAAYEVNWRIDRIRGMDVVLVRDDPANPDVPSSTRVIPLRTDELSTEESAKSGGDSIKSEIDALAERIAAMKASESAQKRITPEDDGENR